MIRTRNITPRSFASVKRFPGTAGNPFDKVLHGLEFLNVLSPLSMGLALLLLSMIGNRFGPFQQDYLFLFYAVDWALISLLPGRKISFGPVNPVVLMLALLRLPFAFLPPYWNLAAEGVGTLLVIYGFFIEPMRLDVHHETFVTPKLAPGQHLRVVHLGDLHMEHTTARDRQIIRVVKELAPDLILFSGDILNLSYLQEDESQADARAFFNELSAPLGIYAVSGSPAVDLPELFPKLVTDTPLTWLDNQTYSIKFGEATLTIYGLTCTHNPDLDEKTLQTMIASANPDAKLNQESFNLLLHHSPDLVPNASRHGFDMQLSGHTHGGQICLPFYGALFTGSLYHKAFEAGRYLVNGMTLYVTRGLGMEGAIAPRVRVLCRPELIVWDIQEHDLKLYTPNAITVAAMKEAEDFGKNSNKHNDDIEKALRELKQ
jgi:Predicted phosphohydrolases